MERSARMAEGYPHDVRKKQTRQYMIQVFWTGFCGSVKAKICARMAGDTCPTSPESLQSIIVQKNCKRLEHYS